MKAIKTLLKLQQKNLDQLILTKKNAVTKLHEIEQLLNIHKQEVKKEFDQYINSNLSSFLEEYLKNAKTIEQSFLTQIAKLNSQIEDLNIKIQESFAEIKRYEIILEQHKQRQLEKILQAETKALDENTIIKYARADE